VSEQTIFPEIELDKIKRNQGMDITIVTTAPTDGEAMDLLKLMGLPFAEPKAEHKPGEQATGEPTPSVPTPSVPTPSVPTPSVPATSVPATGEHQPQ
jgi:hypothetical protein